MQIKPVLLCSALLLGSCQMTRSNRGAALSELPDAWHRLPFHVALVPLEEGEYEVVKAASAKAELKVDYRGLAGSGEALLESSLKEVLEASVFTKVTILKRPAADSPVGEASDAWWLAAAREVGADLLLDPERMRYSEQPDSSGKASNWLLFLTGPAELLIADRTYSLQSAAFDVALYDPWLFDAPPLTDSAQLEEAFGGEGSVRDWVDEALQFRFGTSALVRRFRATGESFDLKYGDRIAGGVGPKDLWRTLFIPSSLLSTDGEAVSMVVADRGALGLARDLAGQIVTGDHEFITRPSSRRARFHLDLDRLRWERSASGALHFQAPIAHRREFAPDGFQSAVCSIGGEEWEAHWATGSGLPLYAWIEMEPLSEQPGGVDAEWARGTLSLQLGRACVAALEERQARGERALVGLRLTDQAGRPQTQSWTFEVGPALGP